MMIHLRVSRDLFSSWSKRYELQLYAKIHEVACTSKPSTSTGVRCVRVIPESITVLILIFSLGKVFVDLYGRPLGPPP